ncbi:MAG: large protein, partial [Bacteroidota bacterium]|nr:large protein [Bacteroidota bacterium]
MKRYLQYCFLVFTLFIASLSKAQIANNCANATQVCNNQLAEQLDDGFGTQECPSGGCGCMLVGEKNTRWFKIVIQTAGTLEFTISPYNGSADYDFSVWNQGAGGICPSASRLGLPDRCNYAAPQSPTGIRGAGNGNSNSATGNLFSNSMAVVAGDVIYILVDNWDGTSVGFRLDFFGGTAGSGTGTTATFSCTGINTCSTCSDPDCQTYRFDSPTDYTFAETAANGACHSPFGYATVKTGTVCGTFTVPSPFTTVEFPLDKGYEITATNGASTTTCLNSAAISYTVWGICGLPISPTPAGTGIYTGLDNITTYKVCKTVTVSGTDCWLSRVCLPFWTMIQNDEPCGAIALTVNAAATAGSNAGATAGLDAGCTAYQDVFYKFTAPASGRIQVNVIPNASSDVKVSLIGPQAGLTGGVNDCNKPCSQMTNVAAGCNDNSGAGGTERLFSFVIPGQTYYVWISGTAARPTATFTVQVTETITNTAIPTPGTQLVGAPDPIPTNDACANATDLSPMCNVVPGTNIGATAECTDPDPQYVDAITLENDVWYKWTAPANNGNSQVTLEVTSISCTDGAGVGSTGIQFGVFYGSCASLTPVSHGTTTLTFTAVAGRTYYFVIDGNAGAQCTFSVNIKRPTITSQSCTAAANNCAGSALNASFNYTYSGTNPGFKWAYCKSGTFGTPCTIDLDNPATYFVYNSAAGLPNPGCTPATYTFVGYILADNGATTIAAGYPTPQPAGANCVRSTNACTFNIYPDIKSDVTVTTTPCSQVVTANAGCAASIVITGTASQTATAGTSGTFTPVTVTWNATYAGSAPAACKTYTVQNTYACAGPTGSNACSTAPQLIVGAAPTASNNNVLYDGEEDFIPGDPVCTDNYGKGVWFTFVAPNSGRASINLTNVGGTGGKLDAVLFLFDSRQALIPDGVPDFQFQSDVCASCSDLSNDYQKLLDQYIGCLDGGGATSFSGTIQDLNPGETYYIMVDAWEYAASSTGTFSIQVLDLGSGPVRPANDNCTGAIDISNIGCGLFPASNVNATSLCGSDLSFPRATTENSVWYTYTASVTGSHIIQYKYATGTQCAGIGSQPGIQFALYTSSNNTCTGVFDTLTGTNPVSTGTTNGSVTVNLVAGQKYYILIDGYGGNQCNFEFQVYNGLTCCTANLGSTEGSDKVLCFGDDVTYGVSANPINFGTNAQSNPVIAWQFSTSQPAVNNPLNVANTGKTYLIGNIDITTAGSSINSRYRDVQGNYPNPYVIMDNTINTYPVTISGFPATSTFNSATDTITICVNAGLNKFKDLKLTLVAPDGTNIILINQQCPATDYGF